MIQMVFHNRKLVSLHWQKNISLLKIIHKGCNVHNFKESNYSNDLDVNSPLNVLIQTVRFEFVYGAIIVDNAFYRAKKNLILY